MKLFLCVLSFGLTSVASDTNADKCVDKDSNSEYLHCLQVLERDYWVSSLTSIVMKNLQLTMKTTTNWRESTECPVKVSHIHLRPFFFMKSLIVINSLNLSMFNKLNRTIGKHHDRRWTPTMNYLFNLFFRIVNRDVLPDPITSNVKKTVGMITMISTIIALVKKNVQRGAHVQYLIHHANWNKTV